MPDNPPSLIWTIHPAEKQPVRAAAALMVIAMICGGLYQVTEELLYSAIAAGVLLLSLSPFFLPARYILDEHGVTCRRGLLTRKLVWSQIKEISIKPGIVYLSPHVSQSVSQNRSILVVCPDNHREVVDYIEKVR